MGVTATHIVWDWHGTLFADRAAVVDATIDAFACSGLPPVTVSSTSATHPARAGRFA